MDRVEKILVPVDFDQHSDRLVEYALFIADSFKAAIQFIHVSESFDGFQRYEYPSIDEIEEGLRAHAQSAMNQLLERVSTSGVTCDGIVLNGDIVDEIIRVAKNEAIDLVLIATHGAKGIERIILGSVAERVMKGAPCPVLMFNPYHGE